MPGIPQKHTTKPYLDPWSDTPPEKLADSTPKTIGFAQQVKGLVSPDNMLDHFFGNRNLETPSSPRVTEKPGTRQEFLVFSRRQTEDETKIIKDSQIILQKLQEQITILEKKEKGLVKEVSKVKIEQLPRKTSIYYLRFLEWLLIVVRQLRMKVEEGRTWLSTFTQRKKKRLGYWQMYKKHGTTFGLSQERVMATQTG